MGIIAVLKTLFGTSQNDTPCVPFLDNNCAPAGRATKKELSQMIAQYYFGLDAQPITRDVDLFTAVGCYIYTVGGSGRDDVEHSPFNGINYHVWVLSFDSSCIIQIAISYQGIKYRGKDPRGSFGNWQTIVQSD